MVWPSVHRVFSTELTYTYSPNLVLNRSAMLLNIQEKVNCSQIFQSTLMSPWCKKLIKIDQHNPAKVNAFLWTANLFGILFVPIQENGGLESIYVLSFYKSLIYWRHPHLLMDTWDVEIRGEHDEYTCYFHLNFLRHAILLNLPNITDLEVNGHYLFM